MFLFCCFCCCFLLIFCSISFSIEHFLLSVLIIFYHLSSLFFFFSFCFNNGSFFLLFLLSLFCFNYIFLFFPLLFFTSCSIYLYICFLFLYTILFPQQTGLGVSKIPIASLLKGYTPTSTSDMDMPQNHPMVRLQFWGLRKWRVALHCYYFQVHSGSE